MSDKLTSSVKPGLMKCSFWYCSRRFFIGLVAIANLKVSMTRKDKAEADKQLKYFRTVVKAGAINLVHKLQLLEAEYMSAPGCWITMNSKEKDNNVIFDRYDEAIVSATRAGFLQDAALANYLCFRFSKWKNVRVHLAEMYLKRSFELWMSWGAVAVASSLVDRHSDMFDSDSVRDSITTSRTSVGSSSSGGMRSRSRFDSSLSAQHKELNVQ